MYAITEQIPTGQYAFFMGGAGHASLALVRDAGTYYEGMAQGSDGLYVIFDVTKQGQMREYGELYARDIIASFDDIGSIFSQLDDKVDNSRVLTDVPENAKFTDTNTTYSEISTAEIDAGTASTLRTITARRIKYILDKVAITISNLTKSDVGLEKVDNTSDLNKPISTATQTALDNKVDNSRVLTDVPAGAEFTDTITTINGKTGVILKEDIVALGIPASMHPNLTLGELTLGGRFKIVYNDIEDSLDIEVI